MSGLSCTWKERAKSTCHRTATAGASRLSTVSHSSGQGDDAGRGPVSACDVVESSPARLVRSGDVRFIAFPEGPAISLSRAQEFPGNLRLAASLLIQDRSVDGDPLQPACSACFPHNSLSGFWMKASLSFGRVVRFSMTHTLTRAGLIAGTAWRQRPAELQKISDCLQPAYPAHSGGALPYFSTSTVRAVP